MSELCKRRLNAPNIIAIVQDAFSIVAFKYKKHSGCLTRDGWHDIILICSSNLYLNSHPDTSIDHSLSYPGKSTIYSRKSEYMDMVTHVIQLDCHRLGGFSLVGAIVSAFDLLPNKGRRADM
jgi:hypothetical protein